MYVNNKNRIKQYSRSFYSGGGGGIHFNSQNSLSVNSPFQPAVEGPNHQLQHESKSPLEGGVHFHGGGDGSELEPLYGMVTGVEGC